ncbi:hypothetical protein P4O66_006237, partial [Electrophorus voltai]
RKHHPLFIQEVRMICTCSLFLGRPWTVFLPQQSWKSTHILLGREMETGEKNGISVGLCQMGALSDPELKVVPDISELPPSHEQSGRQIGRSSALLGCGSKGPYGGMEATLCAEAGDVWTGLLAFCPGETGYSSCRGRRLKQSAADEQKGKIKDESATGNRHNRGPAVSPDNYTNQAYECNSHGQQGRGQEVMGYEKSTEHREQEQLNNGLALKSWTELLDSFSFLPPGDSKGEADGGTPPLPPDREVIAGVAILHHVILPYPHPPPYTAFPAS